MHPILVRSRFGRAPLRGQTPSTAVFLTAPKAAVLEGRSVAMRTGATHAVQHSTDSLPAGSHKFYVAERFFFASVVSRVARFRVRVQ